MILLYPGIDFNYLIVYILRKNIFTTISYRDKGYSRKQVKRFWSQKEEVEIAEVLMDRCKCD